MTLFESTFDTTWSGGVSGFSTRTTSSSKKGFVTSGGTALSDHTGSAIAACDVYPATADQLVQVKVPTTGTSRGVAVRMKPNLASSTDVTFTGYAASHTGTEIILRRFVGDGTSVELSRVTHTLVADMWMRLVAEGSTLTVSTLPAWNGTATQVLQTTDTVITSGGTTGFIGSGAANMAYDVFAGGDLSELANLTGTTATRYTVVITANQPTSDGVSRWRGMIHNLAAERLLPGELIHRRTFDFMGVPGAWTPPEGLTLTAGTATLSDPAAGVGFLSLATGTAIGDAAGIALAYPLHTSVHRAVHLELHGMAFATDSPTADLVVDLGNGDLAGGGFLHKAGAARGYLYSQGQHNRTETNTSAVLDKAGRRRSIGVLLVPETKEVFLTARDQVIGYRDGATTWTPGTLLPAIKIVNTAAASVSLRLTSITVSTYA